MNKIAQQRQSDWLGQFDCNSKAKTIWIKQPDSETWLKQSD